MTKNGTKQKSWKIGNFAINLPAFKVERVKARRTPGTLLYIGKFANDVETFGLPIVADGNIRFHDSAKDKSVVERKQALTMVQGEYVPMSWIEREAKLVEFHSEPVSYESMRIALERVKVAVFAEAAQTSHV